MTSETAVTSAFLLLLLVASGLSTSPWRLPHGQIRDVLQRPTLKPRTTTEQSPVAGNVNAAPTEKTYKTFYRVFYGPPPSSPPDQKKVRPNEGHIVPQNGRAYDRSSQELEDVRAANEHFLRVRTNFRCSVPAPKVVRVQDVYPDPSRAYLPRCAVLHRCADDVGCCDNDAFHCVPRTVQEVTLTFYVLSVSLNPDSPGISNSLEKLLFDNHTECECQLIYDTPRFGGAPVRDSSTKHQHTTSTPSIHHTKEENDWRKCQECPVPFSRREYPDGRCGCDCFDRDKPCLKVKRGKDPLEEVERRCVEAAHCHFPECEYGEYDYENGRCPKRPENYRRTSAESKSHSSGNRWNLLERD